MPTFVILCLQLIIAGGGIVRGTPYPPAAMTPEIRQRLHTVVLPGSPAASSGSGRPIHYNTSKRLQPSSPVIIEPSDVFAFRQHHQPPLDDKHHHHQQQQQQHQLDESYFGQQRTPTHFRQQQQQQHGSPGHMNQPFHGVHHQQQQQYKHFNGDSVESLELQDKQPEEFSLGQSDIENSIDNNRFYGSPALETEFESGVVPPERHNSLESIDLIRERLEQIKQEEDIEIKSNLLMKMLEQLPEGPLPIVYIEDAGGFGASSAEDDAPRTADDGDDTDRSNESAADGGADQLAEQFTANSNKRSGRYYRRYPWKRQNSRSRTYDADARYLCVPSRDDVFKLLVGLHENRIGNHQKTINFCNRKRPAKAIFTNIRFLG